MRTFLRIFFQFLYHQLAFTYDLVAWIVSFGNWKDWTLEVIPFIKGTRTLEIGHGPGHLHRILLNRNLVAVAMDESSTMGRLAKRQLTQLNPSPANDTHQPGCMNLARGLAQQLPFRAGAFDSVIATFPAEYIYDTRTLSEAGRCLSDGGRFIVLPAALPKNGFLSWLYQVTGQAPSEALEIVQKNLKDPFVEAGYKVKTHIIERTSGKLIVLVANKENHVQKTS